MLRNCIFSLFFSLGLIFSFLYCLNTKHFDYDNLEHPFRFLVIYIFSIILSLLFPLIDVKGWVFLSIGIALALFSNSIIAIYSLSGLLLYSCLLSEAADETAFFVYFITSFIGILLFRDIDYNFQVTSSIIISSLVLFVLESVGFVMLSNEEFSMENFIIPIVTLTINAMAMFACLKYFNDHVVNKYRNKFLELNDQEYKIMQDMKLKSRDEYFRSIHTAYLAERIASATGCNVDVCKNLAYYHRIQKAFNISTEECEKILIENDFPPEATVQILDFINKENNLVTKEAGIVYLSDKLISSLQLLFNKDNKAKLDYKDLINALYEKNYIKQTLQNSDLSLKDMKSCREIMLKETLYYDFLR